MDEPVNVISSPEARGNLSTMLRRFREGKTDPMYIGFNDKPDAAVIPFDRYTQLLKIEKAHAGDEELVREVRERITHLDRDGARAIAVSLRDLVREVGPAATQILDDLEVMEAARRDEALSDTYEEGDDPEVAKGPK